MLAAYALPLYSTAFCIRGDVGIRGDFGPSPPPPVAASPAGAFKPPRESFGTGLPAGVPPGFAASAARSTPLSRKFLSPASSSKAEDALESMDDRPSTDDWRESRRDESASLIISSDWRRCVSTHRRADLSISDSPTIAPLGVYSSPPCEPPAALAASILSTGDQRWGSVSSVLAPVKGPASDPSLVRMGGGGGAPTELLCRDSRSFSFAWTAARSPAGVALVGGGAASERAESSDPYPASWMCSVRATSRERGVRPRRCRRPPAPYTCSLTSSSSCTWEMRATYFSKAASESSERAESATAESRRDEVTWEERREALAEALAEALVEERAEASFAAAASGRGSPSRCMVSRDSFAAAIWSTYASNESIESRSEAAWCPAPPSASKTPGGTGEPAAAARALFRASGDAPTSLLCVARQRAAPPIGLGDFDLSSSTSNS
mmetsp:Transcript_23872/g.76616  ORF Transcript_23872/g.76616 Transcript_23872/m.76616 type:complete len:438 (-) Transcript_23872:211-1524(-)